MVSSDPLGKNYCSFEGYYNPLPPADLTGKPVCHTGGWAESGYYSANHRQPAEPAPKLAAGLWQVPWNIVKGLLSLHCDDSISSKNRSLTIDPIGNQTGREGRLLTFSVRASNPDGGALTLTASGLPDGASFELQSGGSSGEQSGVFSWKPDFGRARDYEVTFDASDGSHSTSQSIIIKVEKALLEIHHLNVGQGSSILIIGPNGTTILVDAGPGGTVNPVYDHLKRRNIKVDYVVASHPHADHVGGFACGCGTNCACGESSFNGISLFLGRDNAPGRAGEDDDGNGVFDWIGGNLCNFSIPDPDELGIGDDYYPTKNIFYNGQEPAPNCSDTERFKSFFTLATAKPGVAISLGTQEAVNKWFREPIDLGGGAQVRVVASNGYIAGRGTRVRGVSSSDDKSIGLYVEYGRFDYFAGGDMTSEIPENGNISVEVATGELLQSIADTPATDPVDLYCVNHHGSDGSTSDKFLRLVKPDVAIISVGNNNGYGHPAPSVINRLFSNGVKAIYRTNKGETPISNSGKDHAVGDHIIVTTDGSTYTVSNTTSPLADPFPTD